LNFASGELHYTNAGHLPPLTRRRPDTVEWLEMRPATALGVTVLALILRELQKQE
jgi:serine phosphatase RsbU (regulator of sigma subunit)